MHPRVLKDGVTGLKPLYRGRMEASEVRRWLAFVDDESDPLPEDVRLRRGIPSLGETLQMLQFPRDREDMEMARWCMAYRELYAELSRKAEVYGAEGVALEVDHGALEDFIASFSFSLTGSQEAAVREIVQDLEDDRPMRRVLVGDVGSGKTEVALCAALAALSAGWRVLWLCPTEILAEQTYRRAAKALAGRGYVALWSSSGKLGRHTPADVYVGTHALLYENWSYHKVGLVIADEQHKFGVRQRERLLPTPECNLLEMSATPIPRTYALFVQSIMDVSVLYELPFRRQVRTELVVDAAGRSRALQAVEAAVRGGRQALIVYPSVDSEHGGMKPVLKAYEYWVRRFGDAVGLLHGGLRDKPSVLRRFASGALKVLVSTSAAEVGIDVPGLRACVVANAERFGLVQLHQLRGRVGRRAEEGEFYMVCRKPASAERLRALERLQDGFEVAEADASRRGTGRIAGDAQTGWFFKYFTLSDLEIVTLVKEDLGIL